MKINNKFSFFKNCFTFIIVMFLLQTVAFSAQNSLSGIDVSQKENGEYNIILKLDGKAQVKKHINADNKLGVVLQSTLPSDTLDIIYDNASSVANVIVQKKNKNNTVISFDGDNINNAKLYVKEVSTGTLKQVSNRNNIFSGLIVNDKKTLVLSLITLLILLVLNIFSKSQVKNNNQKAAKNRNEIRRKQLKINTLRNKNLVQSTNIPSIDSGLNGSFNTARMYMSIPAELSVSDNYEEEEIRKAG